MTATSYVTLNNDDLGANKIFRAASASALDTNPVAIAQRGTGAPWLNGIGAIATLTSGSGNWTVPAGVYRIKVTAVGQGARGNVSGDSTTFGTITAGGGIGVTGEGGTATGGDININGGDGGVSDDSGTAARPSPGQSAMTGQYGRGGGGYDAGALLYGSGAGATAIKVMSVEPGDVIAYSVGDGAFAAETTGIIIIEY